MPTPSNSLSEPDSTRGVAVVLCHIRCLPRLFGLSVSATVGVPLLLLSCCGLLASQMLSASVSDQCIIAALEIQSAVPSLVGQLSEDHALRTHLPSDAGAVADHVSSNGADVGNEQDSQLFTPLSQVGNNTNIQLLYQASVSPTQLLGSS